MRSSRAEALVVFNSGLPKVCTVWRNKGHDVHVVSLWRTDRAHLRAGRPSARHSCKARHWSIRSLGTGKAPRNVSEVPIQLRRHVQLGAAPAQSAVRGTGRTPWPCPSWRRSRGHSTDENTIIARASSHARQWFSSGRRSPAFSRAVTVQFESRNTEFPVSEFQTTCLNPRASSWSLRACAFCPAASAGNTAAVAAAGAAGAGAAAGATVWMTVTVGAGAVRAAWVAVTVWVVVTVGGRLGTPSTAGQRHRRSCNSQCQDIFLQADSPTWRTSDLHCAQRNFASALALQNGISPAHFPDARSRDPPPLIRSRSPERADE